MTNTVERRSRYVRTLLLSLWKGGNGDMDPTMIFRMIFGGGTFDDTFGELSMITMMTMVFSPLISF